MFYGQENTILNILTIEKKVQIATVSCGLFWWPGITSPSWNPPSWGIMFSGSHSWSGMHLLWKVDRVCLTRKQICHLLASKTNMGKKKKFCLINTEIYSFISLIKMQKKPSHMLCHPVIHLRSGVHYATISGITSHA